MKTLYTLLFVIITCFNSRSQTSQTLQISGRKLLDIYGKTVVIRGIEQPMWWVKSQEVWVDKIALTGANAMRVLVNHENMTFQDVDDLFAKITNYDIIIFWSVYTPPTNKGLKDFTDINYWNLPEIKQIYTKYKKWIIIDAQQESYANSSSEWLLKVNERVQQLRTWGYDCPLDVISRFAGRDLNCLLKEGQKAVDADPLHKLILGWQAYWYMTKFGEGCSSVLEGYTNKDGWPNGWTYQGDQGISLCSAIDSLSKLNFPIQLGLLKYTEAKNNKVTMDYSSAMTKSQENGIGWLWWPWTGGAEPNWLSDGYELNDLGKEVVLTHPNSISKTSLKANQNITSILNKELESEIQIFPIPANDEISVSGFGNNFEYIIFDFTGRRMLKGAGSQKINIESLKPGSYFLNLKHDGKSNTLKIDKL